MKPHPIDFYVGLSKYFSEIRPPCKGKVQRPLGFRVIELFERVQGDENLYLLYKLNVDTIHAISILRSALGGRWRYAGLKDKDAQTVQFVSSDVEISSFTWERRNRVIVLKRVGLGNANKNFLRGNYFIIDIEFDCNVEDYAETVRGMWKVPGFYGYQRFGTRRPISHVVGKLALLGHWEEAIDVLLGEPFPWESERSKEYRLKYYEEGPKAFLQAPRYLDIERSIAKALLRGLSPERALKRLKVFRLILQSYQSYLYNKLLSKQEDPCDGPTRLPGPGATEYEEVLEEEGVPVEAFKKFSLKAWPRRPCYKTEVGAVARGNLLRVAFELPKGYYATSVLREILKAEPWRM